MTAAPEKKPKPRRIKVFELSPRAQSAVKTKRLLGRGRYKDFREVLRELTRFDTNADELRTRAGNRAVGFGVLVLLLGIAFLIVVTHQSDVRDLLGGGDEGKTGLKAALGVSGTLLALCAIFCVFNLLKYLDLRSINLANDFRACLYPLLDELGEDVDPKSKMRLRLDLRGLDDKKLISKKQVPPGRFKKITESIYRDPWLKLVLDLADDVILVLEIENLFIKHDRRWTSRSRSGKYKFKHKDKWRKLVTVSAALAPPATELAWDPEKVNALAQTAKLKLSEKKGGRVVRLERKFKFKAVNQEPPDVAGPAEVMAMLVQLYALLKPAAAATGG